MYNTGNATLDLLLEDTASDVMDPAHALLIQQLVAELDTKNRQLDEINMRRAMENGMS